MSTASMLPAPAHARWQTVARKREAVLVRSVGRGADSGALVRDVPTSNGQIGEGPHQIGSIRLLGEQPDL